MVYVDLEFKCHATNQSGNFIEVENDFFTGKCHSFIEGFCYDDSKGFTAIYPWKPYAELAAAQTQYEADQAAMVAAYYGGVNSV